MSITASFDASIRSDEITYSEDAKTFRVPIQYDMTEPVENTPTVEVHFARINGDKGLHITTTDGKDAMAGPVSIPVSESYFSDDADTTLYKFEASSETGDAVDMETEVEVVVYVDGEEHDSTYLTFWNTIRGY